MKPRHLFFLIPGLWFSAAQAQTPDHLVGRSLVGHVSRAPLTQNEVRALPTACITIGMGRIDGLFWLEALNRSNQKHLLDQPGHEMARNNSWFHHYCWGILSKIRYFSAPTKNQRESELKTWRGNMTSTIEYAGKGGQTWPFLHVIHKEIAESYFFEDNYPLALASAEKAVEMSPGNTYPAAHVIAIDSLTALGRADKAKEMLSLAITQSPNHRGLRNRMKNFGLEPPAMSEQVAETDLTGTDPASEEGNGTELESSTRNGMEPLKIDPSPSEPMPKQSDSERPAPQIGSGENPYCRFCP